MSNNMDIDKKDEFFTDYLCGGSLVGSFAVLISYSTADDIIFLETTALILVVTSIPLLVCSLYINALRKHGENIQSVALWKIPRPAGLVLSVAGFSAYTFTFSSYVGAAFCLSLFYSSYIIGLITDAKKAHKNGQ